MKRQLIATMLGTALFALPVAQSAMAAPSRVKVGVLNCKVSGGAGFIIGGTNDLTCKLDSPTHKERYIGHITKLGLDIGATTGGVLAWAVMAPTTDMGPGALEGTYGGVTAGATVGVGLSANALIGGSHQSIALQPLSVGASEGLSLAAGVASMKLEWVPKERGQDRM